MNIKLTNDDQNTTVIDTRQPGTFLPKIKTVLDPNLYAFDGDLYDWDAELLAEHISVGEWGLLVEDAEAMHITVTGTPVDA